MQETQGTPAISVETYQPDPLLIWQQEVIDALLAAPERSRHLKRLCQRLESLLPGARVMVLGHKPGREALEIMAEGGLDAEKKRAFSRLFRKVDHTLCGRSLKTGEPLWVEDLQRDQRFSKVRHIAEPSLLAACWIQPVMTAEQQVSGLVCAAFDTPRKATAFDQAAMQVAARLTALILGHAELNSQLRYLNDHDPLTGLYNGVKLRRDVEALFQRAEPFGLIYLDLDLFKEVNDAYGHRIGDLLLKEVGQRIERALIEFPGRLYRLGGDEFAIITQVCNLPDPIEAMNTLCADIIRRIDQPFEIEGHSLNVAVSLGISCGVEAKGDYYELMRMADAALAAAKDAGRRTWRYFDPQMVADLQENLRIGNLLHVALEEQPPRQLDVHYQPILNAHTMEVETFEALVRWTHPEEGPVPPFRFIPIAEKTGLIRALDERVLEIVLDDLRHWQTELNGLNFTVAVNLSALELESQHIARMVQRLRDSDLAGHVEFEITESVMMSNTSETVRLLEQLQEAGVAGLAMDDFGTGYSSMGYLKRFPVTKLKIDQSLVRDIDHDEQDRAISRAVAALGRELNLKVVAEGVETDAHRQLLAGQGIDLLQGYLFAKPMPGEAVVPWLQAFSRQCMLLPKSD